MSNSKFIIVKLELNMTTVYYKLSQAITFADEKSYIVGWFKNKEYRFLSFVDFDKFLTSKQNYGSLHEIIISPNDNKINGSFVNRKDGRLCFDFDLEKKNALFDVNKWKLDIESVIKIVCNNLYHNINTNKLIFVWSSSDDLSKISKHLTIKELYFEDWVPMARQFYQIFIEKWNSNFNYCEALLFVDKQIIRKNGSLRFVGSTKADNSGLLVLDNTQLSFEDSLIRPPFEWNYGFEQNISYDKLKIPCPINIISIPIIEIIDKTNIISTISKNDKYQFLNTFEMVNQTVNNNNGDITYNYRRKTPSYCYICHRIHEHENAFVKISNGITTFHCYRNLDKVLLIENNNKSFFLPVTTKHINRTNENISLTIVI